MPKDNDLGANPGYPLLVEAFAQTLNIDLRSYKAEGVSGVSWQLNNLASDMGTDISGLAAGILSEERVKRAVEENFTNNATSFFRDVNYWNRLETQILPQLLAQNSNRPLRTWSAGCSKGAEPYGLTIILDELSPNTAHTLLATDIDPQALEEAQRASFGYSTMRDVSLTRKRAYFDYNGEHHFVKPEIKGRVKFFRHDLFKDDYPQDLNLILFRHVAMHLTADAAIGIQGRMAEVLAPGGVLMFGRSELVESPGRMGLAQIGENTFQKLV